MSNQDIVAVGFEKSGLGWKRFDNTMVKDGFVFELPVDSNLDYVERLIESASKFSAETNVSLNSEVWIAIQMLG